MGFVNVLVFNLACQAVLQRITIDLQKSLSSVHFLIDMHNYHTYIHAHH